MWRRRGKGSEKARLKHTQRGQVHISDKHPPSSSCCYLQALALAPTPRGEAESEHCVLRSPSRLISGPLLTLETKDPVIRDTLVQGALCAETPSSTSRKCTQYNKAEHSPSWLSQVAPECQLALPGLLALLPHLPERHIRVQLLITFQGIQFNSFSVPGSVDSVSPLFSKHLMCIGHQAG